MSDPIATRRELLQGIGATGTALLGGLAGCLERSPGGKSSVQRVKDKIGTGPIGLPSRPYTVVLPMLTEMIATSKTYLNAERPKRRGKLMDIVGWDSSTDESDFPFTSGVQFTANSIHATYIRAEFIDTDDYTEYMNNSGTELEPHRDFRRYRLSDENFGRRLTAYSDRSKYDIQGAYIDELSSYSEQLIDYHYTGTGGWQQNSSSYAQLIRYLPQGIWTEVYPNGLRESPFGEAAFGQSYIWPDESEPVINHKTVIVYDSEVDEVQRQTERRLSGDRIGVHPIINPSITIQDNVAIIDDAFSLKEEYQ